jgi:hypothetical protein
MGRDASAKRSVKNSLRCKTIRELNIVKATHLCCDIVKEICVYFGGKPS